MVLVWLIRIAICLSFVYEGYTKIVSRRFQYDFFVQFLKYPKEFMIPVGVFELIFALLCIVKPSVGIVMLHFDMGLYAHAVFFRHAKEKSRFLVAYFWSALGFLAQYLAGHTGSMEVGIWAHFMGSFILMFFHDVLPRITTPFQAWRSRLNAHKQQRQYRKVF